MNDTELCADLGVAPPINGGQNREELIAFARYCAARIARELAGVSGWELFLVGGLEWLSQKYPNAPLNSNPNDNLSRGQMDATSLTIGVRYRGLSKRNPPSRR